MAMNQKDMQIMLTCDVMITSHICLSPFVCRRLFRSLTRARATCTAWIELCYPGVIIWQTPAFSEIYILSDKQSKQSQRQRGLGYLGEFLWLLFLPQAIQEESW